MIDMIMWLEQAGREFFSVEEMFQCQTELKIITSIFKKKLITNAAFSIPSIVFLMAKALIGSWRVHTFCCHVITNVQFLSTFINIYGHKRKLFLRTSSSRLIYRINGNFNECCCTKKWCEFSFSRVIRSSSPPLNDTLCLCRVMWSEIFKKIYLAYL